MKQEVLLVLPPAALIVLNAAWPHADHTQYVYDWYSLSEKLLDSSYELGRFGGRVSSLLIAMRLRACCWDAGLRFDRGASRHLPSSRT